MNSLADQSIAAGVRNLFQEAFGAQLGKVISERGQRVLWFGQAECFQDWSVELSGGNAAASGNVGEAHQRMHHRQLSRVIELKAWYPLPIRQDGWLGQFP